MEDVGDRARLGHALAVVIGEDWATWEAQHRAQAARVEWKVGAELSEGFLAFRRLPSR